MKITMTFQHVSRSASTGIKMNDLERDMEDYYRKKFALEIEDYIYNSIDKPNDEESRWFFNGMRYAMMLLRHGYSP